MKEDGREMEKRGREKKPNGGVQDAMLLVQVNGKHSETHTHGNEII